MINKQIIYTILISIILVSVIYFYYKNNLPPTKNVKEGFSAAAANVDEAYRSTIKETFKKTLSRDPYEYEVKLYAALMHHPYDSNSINKKIKGSTEYAELISKEVSDIKIDNKSGSSAKTPVLESFSQEVENLKPKVDDYIRDMTFDDRMDAYKKIVKVFEKTLNRIPITDELNFFTYKLHSNILSLTNIEMVLQSSREYDILTRNQTNVVNASLVQNITDAQLNLMVDKAYDDVMRKDLTDDLLKSFLKKKLHEYSLDIEKLKLLIKVMHNLDIQSGNNSDIAQCINGSKDTSDKPQPKEEAKAESEPAPEPAPEPPKEDDAGKGGSSKQSDTDEIILTREQQIAIAEIMKQTSKQKEPLNPPKEERNTGENEKGFHCASPLLDGDKYGKCMAKNVYSKQSPYYDTLYTANNNFQSTKENCSYDFINVEKDQKLAKEQMKRHAELYGKTCGSSTEKLLEEQLNGYGKPFDSNAKLNLRNTKYGAFLEDVEDTKVGSILPRFVYKELSA